MQRILQRLQAVDDALAPKKSLLKRARHTPANLYIWGDVGRGKSMLMDLFFDHVPIPNKRRVHFHAFMQEVHASIHQFRQQKLGDPVGLLVKQLSTQCPLLCFDEAQATDVADATLIFRLFEGLFDHGVTIVATSNRPPSQLYTGGVQAERFAKVTALLESRMEVLSLNSDKDYRRSQGATSNAYFPPRATYWPRCPTSPKPPPPSPSKAAKSPSVPAAPPPSPASPNSAKPRSAQAIT